LAQRHLTVSLRGAAAPRPASSGLRLFRRSSPATATAADTAAAAAAAEETVTAVPLRDMQMRTAVPGFFQGAARIARTELRSLLASPALYIFAALILLQVFGNSLVITGAFETRLLLTPGQLAAGSVNVLSFLLLLLLMFYTVESLERDRATGLAALAYTAPTRTGSILLGKSLANSAVSLLMMIAAFLGYAIALLVQGTVPLNPLPFLIVWGLLLLPTVLLWTAFVTAVQAVTAQRYTTYGVCLAALMATGYRVSTEKATWVDNWPLWGAVHWTDMGPFQLDREALVLNRLMVLGLAVLFTAIAVRGFARRQPDAIHTFNRLQPRELGRQAVRLAPFALLPLVCGVMLWFAVEDGLQGKAMEKKGHDYWKQNLATWKDAPLPSIAGVDLDLQLDPERSWFHNRGSYELINDREEKPLRQIALSGAPHWEKLRWTLNGKPYEPENRSSLYVFTPPAPLALGQKMRIGFEFEGRFPWGITKNSGRVNEFILPSGVVLTSFSTGFVPLIGYQERTGIKKDENDYEPRVYPDDFYVGRTDIGFGVSRPFPTRIAVTGPDGYRYNSVGSLVSDTVKAGQRTMVWKSDQPVRLFNVVAGRWKEKRGNGTVLYYHPEHDYNVDEMILALDSARRYYSEWFYPFPWRELKVSEFPQLSGYAQGFPTNITFSEGIGFLTRPDVKANTVFMVTAHESAHQWWGNILTPGKGPGTDVLSEGMSHFSTLMLMEQVKGNQARMELAKRLEERYNDRRRVDAERPLVKIDDSHDGDETVKYDKGGWVAWMLYRQMGRERALAGLRQFMADWKDGPD
ncbi:MAG TPA: M1 family aminopeptidase, partial [Thermoanaerobaculia bacterium]|nr:M1 family aminopeptidase [Thermoanaerobaculia bacterium]